MEIFYGIKLGGDPHMIMRPLYGEMEPIFIHLEILQVLGQDIMILP